MPRATNQRLQLTIGAKDNASRVIKKVTQLTGGLIRITGKLSVAGGLLSVGGAVGVAAGLRKTARELDQIHKHARNAAVSAEQLQVFRRIGEEGGVKIRQVGLALQRVNRRIGEAKVGAGELLGTLQKFDIAVQGRSTEAIFEDLVQVMRETEDASLRTAIAFKAFDSEGAGFGLSLAAADAEEVEKRMRSLGTLLDEDLVRAGAHAHDSFTQLGEVFQRVFTRLAGRLLPAATNLANVLSSALGPAIDESLGKMDDYDPNFLVDGLIDVLDIIERVIRGIGAFARGFIQLARIGITSLQALEEAWHALPWTDTQAEDEIDDLNDSLYHLGLRAQELATIGNAQRDNWLTRAFISDEAIQLARDQLRDVEAEIAAHVQRRDDLLAGAEASKVGADFLADLDAAEAGIQAGEDFLAGFVRRFRERVEEERDKGSNIPPIPVPFEPYLPDGADTANLLAKQLHGTVQGTISSALSQGFERGVPGVLAAFGDALKSTIINAIAQSLVQSAFGGLLKGLFGSLGGAFSFGGGKAIGGPVRGGTTYLVGERGPELFTPRSSGLITPNNQLGGAPAAPVYLTQNIQANVHDEGERLALARAVSDATMARVADAQRRRRY